MLVFLQDVIGLVLSILLLGDFSLVLLTLLQLYSLSLGDVFLVLFILPLAILSPFPAGINALFSHGPRRSASLARIYALWNLTSLTNVVSISHLLRNLANHQFHMIYPQVVAFICGFKQNRPLNQRHASFQPWNT